MRRSLRRLRRRPGRQVKRRRVGGADRTVELERIVGGAVERTGVLAQAKQRAYPQCVGGGPPLMNCDAPFPPPRIRPSHQFNLPCGRQRRQVKFRQKPAAVELVLRHPMETRSRPRGVLRYPFPEAALCKARSARALPPPATAAPSRRPGLEEALVTSPPCRFWSRAPSRPPLAQRACERDIVGLA